MNFDEYLPVFIYSHAQFPSLNSLHKHYDPDQSKTEFDAHYSRTTTFADFFTTVPNDIIIIDPITPGTFCSSGYEIDHSFPYAISKLGNNHFLKSKRYPAKQYNSLDFDAYDHKYIQHLYRNTKLYYPGETINNLYICFDTREYDEVPWNIRVPLYDDRTNDFKQEYEINLYPWTRKYTLNKSSTGLDNAISLENILKKLAIEKEDEDSVMYREKLAIYLISCRGLTKQSSFGETPELYQRIIQNQRRIIYRGLTNTEELRPHTTSQRITRSLLWTEDEPGPIESFDK